MSVNCLEKDSCGPSQPVSGCEYTALLKRVRDRIKEKVFTNAYTDSKELMSDIKASTALHEAAFTVMALLQKEKEK